MEPTVSTRVLFLILLQLKLHQLRQRHKLHLPFLLRWQTHQVDQGLTFFVEWVRERVPRGWNLVSKVKKNKIKTLLSMCLQCSPCGANSDIRMLFLPRCMKRRRGLKMRICLSIYLCGKRVDCDKTEERSVQIFISYERSFCLVFREE